MSRGPVIPESFSSPINACSTATGTADAHRLSAAWRISGFYAVIVALHLLGWGLYLYYARSQPALVGLGLAAYLFGLRHAFDADHISSIDDTVRYLLAQRQQPFGVGFFFSLGHSTIVFALGVAITFAALAVTRHMPALQQTGAVVGTLVSGAFLWLVGILNLLILLQILQVWRSTRGHRHHPASLDALLARRGFMNRFLGQRFAGAICHSWQIYPVGVLFGLGFDTASEVGLLAMTAGASTGHLPAAATLSLPILFAAGMLLMDTTDGVIMCKAYNWALMNPLRRVFYNATTTGLSVAVALVIGSIEMLQVLADTAPLQGAFWDFVRGLGLGDLGYVVVALFLIAWGASLTVWKFGHVHA